MSKIAVIYWSGTGNTQQMAEAIANQAHADLFTASEFSADKAANYDAFAFGCSAMGAEQLEEDAKGDFLRDVAAELAKQYPKQENGEILFRYPRLFFMVTKK